MKTELRGTKFFVVDEDNKDIGYIDFDLNGNDLHVKHTIVTPKYRGGGYGNVLVEEFFNVYPYDDYNYTSGCWFFTRALDKLNK